MLILSKERLTSLDATILGLYGSVDGEVDVLRYGEQVEEQLRARRPAAN